MEYQHHIFTIPLTFLLFLSIFSKFSSAVDILTPSQSLNDGEKLVSSWQSFELGFFSPGKSTNRYLGIWFKATPDIIVWVANRNNPLTDSNGTLTINNRGNLLLLNQSRTIIWSTNASRAMTNPVAQLLETGNFVVRSRNSNSSKLLYEFQSFDYPTDTIISGMKLGWDLKSGLERYLTSWKSPDDPSNGDFIFRMNITGLPQLTTTKGTTLMFSSGPWNGIRFSGLPVSKTNAFVQYFIFNEKEAYYMFEPGPDKLISRLVMNGTSGLSQHFLLPHNGHKWSLMFSVPYEDCQTYEHCGPNGLCRTGQNPICTCLEGFESWSQDEWGVLDWSHGCKRKVSIDCEKGEGFVKIETAKLPDLNRFWLNKSMSLEECRELCLNNCSCTAYANSDITSGGNGCLMWFGNLVDVRELRVEGSNQDFYIRLSASEIKSLGDAQRKRRVKTIIVVAAVCGILCVLCILVFCIIWKFKKRVISGPDNSQKESLELPMFDWATIIAATNNFSPKCLIGAGGFGPVYKGTLSTEQEVAVKRLSKNSGQGLNEFKNEVELIAKLQHRNLVALLGCCIEGEERMLIYEYMSNKSLDYFIFDDDRRTKLGWEKRFDIIMGVTRGLLYLHRDSKLQIIHRDLKASNILLDENMNPKISDFGLARIFEDDDEVKTRRIVGTYGYMSPEYAVDGEYSVKSDVYSFGVLLLEIVSGKKNTRFRHPDHHHNLLGHAWMLWNEDKVINLMDDCLKSCSNEAQVLRCIQVGLLCVQKFPNDRPTMSSVVFMLENLEVSLPRPKQPGFFIERCSTDEASTSRNTESHSENLVTVSLIDAR